MRNYSNPCHFISTPQATIARRRALALVVILALIPLHWLLFQGQEVVPGVITRPLGPCDVDWFENRGGVLVLGCPHLDMLKLGPLPVEQPWWEHSPYYESVARAD